MKTKPLQMRRIGNVPFTSIVNKRPPEKGGFLAIAKFNGEEYSAVGDTERLATMNLSKKINELTANSKLSVHN